MNLQNIDAVLFDLDGTIYYGSEIIPGANDTIAFFRNSNKKVFFTSNNSTKTRKQIYERLVKIGVDANDDEVLTSGYIAADYAARHDMKDIHIFGSANLIKEFRSFHVKINQEESAENLLIGYDPDATYEDLTKAVRVALHAKKIMACNLDRVYAGEGAKLFPGCGAMTAPIEWCANRRIDLIIGKPNTMFVDFLKKKYNIVPEKALVIGDTHETDVEMAKRAGCPSILISNEQYIDTDVVKSIGDVPSVFGTR